MTLSEFIANPIQAEVSQTWYDSALKHNNAIKQPWSTAELYALGGAFHDEDPDALGWMRTCDTLLASEDADTFIAGVSVLAETCRRAMVKLWRDLLSAPAPLEARKESPRVVGLFAKLDQMLGMHFEQHWERDLDEIDTKARESRAYQCLVLMACDYRSLNFFQESTQNQANLPVPPQHAMDRELETITKHGLENDDNKLKFDLLSRQIITSPRSSDDAIIRDIAALWNKTRNSWDCLKLLASVQRLFDVRSGEFSRLLDEITSHCGELNRYLGDTPLLDQTKLPDFNIGHRTCDDLTDLMFSWQRTAASKKISHLSAQYHLSLFDACVKSRAPVDSMPGGFLASTGKTCFPFHDCMKSLIVLMIRSWCIKCQS